MIIEVDPLRAFEKAPEDHLVSAAGLIPYFAVEALQEHPEGPARDVYDKMVSIYGFGDFSGAFTGTVSEEGVYSYPEDPDLSPIMKLYFPGSPVEVFVYQYAIIAVRDDQETITSRMD
jgi:hypothetical protein